MDYRLIIFDFDGTLADSFPFFAGVFNQLAARHGFRPIDAAEVPALRQRSPRELMEHVGMPRWKLPLVAKDFIALMRQNQHQVQLFDGVPRMLRDLAEADLQLAIVSSNAEDNVRRILGADTAPLFASYESACRSSANRRDSTRCCTSSPFRLSMLFTSATRALTPRQRAPPGLRLRRSPGAMAPSNPCAHTNPKLSSPPSPTSRDCCEPHSGYAVLKRYFFTAFGKNSCSPPIL